MTLFNINFNELLRLLLPPIWSKKSIDENDNAQWLNSLIVGVKTLYSDSFIPYRDKTLYDLTHTTQVISLEHYLNEYFSLSFTTDPNINNPIYIEDIRGIDKKYIYKHGVTPQEAIYLINNTETGIETFIFNANEYYLSDSFSINVPTSLQSIPNFEGIINDIVNRYRNGGFLFTIIYY